MLILILMYVYVNFDIDVYKNFDIDVYKNFDIDVCLC